MAEHARETPEQRIRERWARDKADEMSPAEWDAWIDALPLEEFLVLVGACALEVDRKLCHAI